jgi:hypothetical protein
MLIRDGKLQAAGEPNFILINNSVLRHSTQIISASARRMFIYLISINEVHESKVLK